MITTDDDELAAKARSWRNYGKTTNFSNQGINSRLDELQAVLLSIKLRHLQKWNHERIRISDMYEARLHGVGDIRFQKTFAGAVNVRHIFPIITGKRDLLRRHLNSAKIDTLIHYDLPIHLQESFSWLRNKKGDFPISESVCDSELSLPIYPGLGEAAVDYVCEYIRGFFKDSR